MRRLPVNLATHPIEHRQWVRRIVVVASAIVAAVSLVHLALAWSLIDESVATGPDTETLELLRDWSIEVTDIAGAADPRQARRLAVAVGIANALIDQRAFPWGVLFEVLEEVMPDDVRLETIQPVATAQGVRVSLTAASASGNSLLDFLAALEGLPEFLSVYPGRQLMGPDGDLRLTVEAMASPFLGKSEGGLSEDAREATGAPEPEKRP